jgi:hypothetical protein
MLLLLPSWGRIEERGMYLEETGVHQVYQPETASLEN